MVATHRAWVVVSLLSRTRVLITSDRGQRRGRL